MFRAVTSVPGDGAYILREMFGFWRSKSADAVTRARAHSDVGELALLHVDALYNFARYLTGTPIEADDLVQEAFARALGAAASFETGTNVKAWLFRILRNVYIDRRRRAHHDPLHLVGNVVGHDPDGDEAWEPVDDRARSALSHIEAKELHDAVMSLDESYRTPLLLDLEGMTENEVAQVLNCKVGTVKSRLSRARAQLRRQLAGESPMKEARDEL
jgi:RNA polymerase sigma-70 factor (ECF subfamily)